MHALGIAHTALKKALCFAVQARKLQWARIDPLSAGGASKRIVPIIRPIADRVFTALAVRNIRIKAQRHSCWKPPVQRFQGHGVIWAIDHAVNLLCVCRRGGEKFLAPIRLTVRRLGGGPELGPRMKFAQRLPEQDAPLHKLLRGQLARVSARRKYSVNPGHAGKQRFALPQHFLTRLLCREGIPHRDIQIQPVRNL